MTDLCFSLITGAKNQSKNRSRCHIVARVGRRMALQQKSGASLRQLPSPGRGRSQSFTRVACRSRTLFVYFRPGCPTARGFHAPHRTSWPKVCEDILCKGMGAKVLSTRCDCLPVLVGSLTGSAELTQGIKCAFLGDFFELLIWVRVAGRTCKVF